MVNLIKSDSVRKLHVILVLFSLCIIVITTFYGVIASIVQGVDVVGQAFVDVEFPPIHIFPIFYMKPITWLNFALIVFVYSALELFKEKIARFTNLRKAWIKVIIFTLAALSIYEVLFNFTLWGGLIASDSLLGKLNPDLIINPFPNPNTPWNIVFATKIYTTATVVCVYLFYFFNRLGREENILS